MLHRFFCENLNNNIVQLDSVESHHLKKVRRLSKSERVELFDGNGTSATAVITEVSKKNIILKIEKRFSHKKPAGNRIIIASAIAKAARFDMIVTKCTELGIDCILPVICERTVKLSKNPDVVKRWTNLAISAMKQCRRNHLPKIDRPLKLSAALESLKTDYPEAKIIFGSLDRNSPSLINMPPNSQDIIAFIGPEGGFMDNEVEMLKNADARGVSLTETVLRIETAAIAFAAVLTTIRNAQNSK